MFTFSPDSHVHTPGEQPPLGVPYQLLAAQNTGVITQLARFEEARNAAWLSAQTVITTAVSRLTDVSAEAGAALQHIAARPAEAPVDITAIASLLSANSQSQLQRLLESNADRQEGMFQRLLAAFVEHATTVARANRAARPTVQRIMAGPRPIIVEVPPSRQQSAAQVPQASPPRAPSPTAPGVADGNAPCIAGVGYLRVLQVTQCFVFVTSPLRSRLARGVHYTGIIIIST
jgi:hypothetical protein